MHTSNIALIVGGSSGMGLATAKQLIAKGISVVILGNKGSKLATAKSDLEAISKGGALSLIHI